MQQPDPEPHWKYDDPWFPANQEDDWTRDAAGNVVPDAARSCPHTVTTNLRCDACGEFVGVPPAEWSADARSQS